MDSMVHVGVGKDTVTEARQAIVDIISCKDADQSVRMKALEVFQSVCKVENTTITGCHFTSKK